MGSIEHLITWFLADRFLNSEWMLRMALALSEVIFIQVAMK